MSSRLSRARALLTKRLARHGLALSAGPVTSLLCANELSACVPSSLPLSTANVAKLYSAGQAAADGAIPMNVVSLTKGMLNTMLWNRFQKAGAVVLMAAFLATGTGLMFGPLMAKGPADEKKAVEANPATKDTIVTVPSTELRLTYWRNEASADEKFTGKKMRITGAVSRVKGLGGARGYLLTMEDRLFRGAPNPEGPDISLVFEFPYEARKELAGLSHNQQVTIEGRCLGRRGSQQERIIIQDCKIIGTSP